jgi:hypothetical protein
LGHRISDELAKLPEGSLVMGEDYQRTSLIAFYVPNHPRTYYVGSWFADPKLRARQTQFDLWPDRQLDRPELLGKDAIYHGHGPPPDFVAAFEKVEELPPLDIVRNGQLIQQFHIWRCRGFKGMKRMEPAKRF